MVPDVIRDAPFGQIVRFVTRNKVFQYPEEKDDWRCPRAEYGADRPTKTLSEASTNVPTPATEKEKLDFPDAPNALSSAPTRPDADGASSAASVTDLEASRILSRIVSRPQISRAQTQASLTEAYEDAVRQETVKTQPSRTLIPERTADNRILVTWYTTDDQANPQNWSQGKKALVIMQIYMYTLAIYIAGAIYTPAIPTLIEKYDISPTVASLGLSMYVLAYGLGALVFSPMSEIPIIGRNPPYIITFFIFLIITIPLGLINNFAGFVVLRFFQGFFGSPALATGGASITDVYSLLQMPYLLTGWAGAATAGPALGPMISGFSVPVEGWHWSMWEILWLGGPIFISLMICLPETSSPAILLQRAQRLRKRLVAQGKHAEAAQLVAQSEIDQASMTVADIAKENLLRPFQINILDPAVAFTSIYIGLIYGIFYSFFECFPLVYGAGLPAPSITRGYGMNLGEQGLIFLSVAVGVAIAVAIYIWYLHYHANPALRAQLAKGQLGAPETRLVPGLYASVLAPAALFMFAWTGFNSPDIHWIVPTIGIVLFVVAIFLVFQVIFIYLALTYPMYSASLFAMNDAVRSSVAAGSIHYSTPLFHTLGIGKGGSLLGGLMVMGVVGIWGLWLKGSWLRGKSRFAAK
ncbi:hypothetical protein OHC33_004210 [Knufia fluminis]|uniref:Major facilitator superfamily (MFS) profile domain-containing protein n=1 Tax=Knufia fluminis TaxID=191047 RepID=A0AAN8EM73_9EURO|nr:hypothetical protein OHC33_004210 [Knufia fluminis]